MGRYYHGDIEGKFWFGVQSSTDADFFGVTHTEPNYVEYYFDKDNLIDIRYGVEKCQFALGKNLEYLDAFFDANETYNDEMLNDWYKEKYNTTFSDGEIRTMLAWYARYYLGKKILDCVMEHDECAFTAEL
jgi:hypothetical protein